MGTAVESVDAGLASPFRSRAELHEVLERMLEDADSDQKAGATVRAANVATRLEIPDMDTILHVASGRGPGHSLTWTLADDVDWEPKLEMTMDAEVANRYLQGRESVAIGAVRGRIHTVCRDARVALRYFPAARVLFAHYSRIVRADYPHLAL